MRVVDEVDGISEGRAGEAFSTIDPVSPRKKRLAAIDFFIMFSEFEVS